MSRKLQEEFISVIAKVTKSVTNDVIENTSIKALEKHSQMLGKVEAIVKNFDTKLVKDKKSYENIRSMTEQSTKEFYKNLSEWNNAIEKENKLIISLTNKADKFNKESIIKLDNYLGHIENLEKEYLTTQEIIRDIEIKNLQFLAEQKMFYEQAQIDKEDYQKMFNNMSLKLNIIAALSMLFNAIFIIILLTLNW
ncbi:hypothetical protein [Veillonella agrestimuris]|uniref:hypothetical protein n=1 Tax=Veillonella agrestimuris TaxID=2941340 RepID=UPI00203F5284|nr:hypothetical protein [Veillonella agrestimuris]